MSFSGFSEADIHKLRKNVDSNKQQRGSYKTVKKVSFKPNTNASRSKALFNNNTNNVPPPPELPENARLNVQPKTNNNVNNFLTETEEKNDEVKEEPKNYKKEIEENNHEVKEHPKNDKKFRDLDEFEARQKLIEEQNRKRKELLAQALADRTRRTQEEAQKLGEIQQEFQKLDAMLSCDVKILRKQIEVASIEFTECQKRYHRIEKEFLDAKLLLHQKREKKEMLTEHLCTIIEKNEERKAEKLNELLMKLQLTGPDGGNVIDNQGNGDK